MKIGKFVCSHFNIEDGRRYAAFSASYALFQERQKHNWNAKKIWHCVEKVLWLTERVKSGLQSFLVLLTFWPNTSLLWGCLMHWKRFSSTSGLYSLEANSGWESADILKISKLISYWWKWKMCLLCYGKKHNRLFGQTTSNRGWPVLRPSRLGVRKTCHLLGPARPA